MDFTPDGEFVLLEHIGVAVGEKLTRKLHTWKKILSTIPPESCFSKLRLVGGAPPKQWVDDFLNNGNMVLCGVATFRAGKLSA